MIPIFSAMAGAVLVLILEWTFFHPRPVQLPVIISNQNAMPVVSNLAPNEISARIRINPCIDLRSYVCTIPAASDPTGKVKRESEGEVEALRIYEGIIRSKRKLTQSEIDEALAKKIYTPKRTGKFLGLFEKVKQEMLTFIDSQSEKRLRKEDKDLLKTRIEHVELNMPPPASVYAGETDLFTRSDVYFERLSDGRIRIRVGGAVLFSVQSEFNLAFTIAHELAHSIDPCELLSDKITMKAYSELIECFGSFVENLSTECSSHGKLAEVFADWMATEVVARLLQKAASKYKPSELRIAAFNSVRDLCREEGVNLTQSNQGLASAHPNAAFRVNQIFAQHPAIQKILGCSENVLINPKNNHCFWNKP